MTRREPLTLPPVPTSRLTKLASAALLLLPAVVCSCGKPEVALPPLRTSELPQRVNVPTTAMTVGVPYGAQFERTVEAFSITQTPITVAEYKKCVSAGACSVPAWRFGECGSSAQGLDGYTYDAEPYAPEAPVTCVSVAQAKSYCDWVGGGRLPNSEQWALAARGPSLARHAWGNEPPNCDRHFRLAFGPATMCCDEGCETKPISVGRHPEGASPYGLTDVLTTRGELIGASSGNGWLNCRSPFQGCVANGDVPGAIDMFSATGATDKPDADMSHITAAFRCVWEGES